MAGGLVLHPVTCFVLCMSPKAEGEPVVLFWKSTPDYSPCLWEALAASADSIVCTTATAVYKKKDSCVTMNQQMRNFFVEHSPPHVLWEGKK